MHAPLPWHVSKMPVPLLPACAKDGRAQCKDARATPLLLATQRCARFERLREVRPSLVASFLLATFSPTIRRRVKGGSAIKEGLSPTDQPPSPPPSSFFTGQFH